MSDFIYSFISYRIHYSSYLDIFIPSVFVFFYSDTNKLLLCAPQERIVVTTVEDSVLRTEMVNFESQEEDVPKCILFFKPMS